MKDRIIGYICLILIFISILFFIGYFLFNKQSSTEIRIVEFNNISGLSFINIQDPVLFRGFQIGYVKSIVLKKNKVYLTIELKRPIIIYNDHLITVGAQGIMGDRFLNIDPGNLSNTLIPPEKILNGVLLDSPPEAVAEMEQLVSAIKELNVITDRLLKGSEKKQSFVSFFKITLTDFDSTIALITQKSVAISNYFPELIDTISNLVNIGSSLSSALKKILPDILLGSDTILISGKNLVCKIDTLIATFETSISNYKGQDLSNLQKTIDSVRKNLYLLQDALKKIHSEGMYLPVRL